MKPISILGAVALLAASAFAQSPDDKKAAPGADDKKVAAIPDDKKVAGLSAEEKAAQSAADDKRAILEKEQTWLKANWAYDANALPNLLRMDYIDVDENGKTRNGAQLLRLWEEAPEAKKVATSKLKPNINAIGIKLFGDVALVTGGITFLGAKPDAAGIYPAIRFIRVWVKVKGQWQLATSQTTRTVPDHSAVPAKRPPAKKS